MANIHFAERENAPFHPPLQKMRQRLQSAPEKLLKSPMTAGTLNTPLSRGRKAFGNVNKMSSTPGVSQEKKSLKQQEAKVKHGLQTKVEEYPEIEKFIPYDPLEFEKYCVPEDLVALSGFALSGLACCPAVPHLCEDDLEKLDPIPDLSPIKMPKCSDYCTKLDFLQTIDELIELPPEPLYD